ncbi:MAG: hypothetical protein C0447_01765 [Methylobacterium sp.]|nr:hypothetical protein [Methylobacterium sp.]
MEAEQVEREAILQKTVRLRALRLAKEAADAETAAIVAAEQARIKTEAADAKAAAKALKAAETAKRATKSRAKA